MFRDQLIESCKNQSQVREERLKNLRRRKTDLEAMQQRLINDSESEHAFHGVAFTFGPSFSRMAM